MLQFWENLTVPRLEPYIWNVCRVTERRVESRLMWEVHVNDLEIGGGRMTRVRRRVKWGYDIGTPQELLGPKDVRTTMVYAHVLNRGEKGVKSRIDSL